MRVSNDLHKLVIEMQNQPKCKCGKVLVKLNHIGWHICPVCEKDKLDDDRDQNGFYRNSDN